MSQPPKRRPPQQPDPRRSNPPRRPADYQEDEYPPQRRRSSAAPQRGGPYYQQRPRYVEPKRDMFPILMGGLIGAMVIGVGLIVILLLNNNSGTPAAGNNVPVASETPPRLTMDAFKKLYDNTATRPMVIDVRAAEAYNEGHIAGALSMPEANIDTLIAQIPKDKLVIAYCQ